MSEQFPPITLQNRAVRTVKITGPLIVESHVNYQVLTEKGVVAYEKADWVRYVDLPPEWSNLFGKN